MRDVSLGGLLVDGAELEYRHIPASGQDGGMWLVFLHEGLGSVSLWRDFPDKVARATGLPALVFSRRGYGGSSGVELPRPLNYLEQEAATWLPKVLDAAGICRCILVGHSDGATIALLAAAWDKQGRIAGAVAMAPHSYVEDFCIKGIREARQAFESGGLREKLSRHHGTNTDTAFYGWNDTWLNPGFRSWDIRGQLAAIACPLLVIQGEGDEYATLDQVTVITERVPQARSLVLPACGHSPQRDQEAAVIDAIAGFVA